MLRHLASAGHEVTVCSTTRSDAEVAGVEELQCEGIACEAPRVREWLQYLRMLTRFASGGSLSCAYFYSKRLAMRVKELVQAGNWDMIIVHCSSMGHYVSGVESVPKLLDFADMDSQKWLVYAQHRGFPMSLLYAKEGRRLERVERGLVRAFDLCTTISTNELESLMSLDRGAEADWFPNGVDLDYFHPSAARSESGIVVFVGRMDYFPNEDAMLWFREAVWPLIRERQPGLRLRIVGANPSARLRRLDGQEGVEVTGSVDDVRPYVRDADVSVAPLRIARGMQNKVLECMAMGVPVITTSLVAAGLGLSEDGPLRVADTAADYAREILALTGSPDERERLATESRRMAERQFSWDAAMEKLDALVERALATGRSRSSPAYD